jgi:hypothetical protein
MKGAENKKAQPRLRLGFFVFKALAMTYFLTGDPQYHRRDVVSRSCSGWEGVVPTRYGRQEFGRCGRLVGRTHAMGRSKALGFDRICYKRDP